MSNRPNILMFHVDNVSVGDFGCYGGAYPLGATTPNVDRFARESLQLTNYNVEAQCTPSRSALMTGRHPVRTGCISALPGSGLVAWEVTIADKLKALGYSNACYGKWHCGEDVGRLPTDKGFDYWYGLYHTWDVALWPGDKWFQKENLEPEHIVESKGKGDVRNVKVLDAEVRRNIDLEFMEKAGRWMEDAKAKDQPFFIYFNHSNVHFPVLPRAEYEHASNGGAVADCIQMVDGDFKVLLDKIDALQLRDNTIVIFAGDNGRDTSFHAPGNRECSRALAWRVLFNLRRQQPHRRHRPVAGKDRAQAIGRDDAHHRLVPDAAEHDRPQGTGADRSCAGWLRPVSLRIGRTAAFEPQLFPDVLRSPARRHAVQELQGAHPQDRGWVRADSAIGHSARLQPHGQSG